MRINNNMMAMNTHRQLGAANAGGAKSMEKLSSGFRINRAGDDAAGLSISEKMRGQIRGLNQASTNAQDSISLIQTAEGALTESHAILQRMRELAVQSANDTNVNVDRGALQSEVDQLAQELSRIAETTEFNTQKLLDGKFTDKTFHIGANKGQNIKLDIGNMDAIALKAGGKVTSQSTAGTLTRDGAVVALFVSVGGTIGLSSVGGTAIKAEVSGYYEGLVAAVPTKVGGSDLFRAGDAVIKNTVAFTLGTDIHNQTAADTAITTINTALGTVSSQRSTLGAYQNRLEHTINNLDNVSENLQAAESRIRDVDMAKEMMEQTKQNILQQASTAMLAQANQAPQTVLSLLR